jgi:hypothetical protein
LAAFASLALLASSSSATRVRRFAPPLELRDALGLVLAEASSASSWETLSLASSAEVLALSNSPLRASSAVLAEAASAWALSSCFACRRAGLDLVEPPCAADSLAESAADLVLALVDLRLQGLALLVRALGALAQRLDVRVLLGGLGVSSLDFCSRS